MAYKRRQSLTKCFTYSDEIKVFVSPEKDSKDFEISLKKTMECIAQVTNLILFFNSRVLYYLKNMLREKRDSRLKESRS